MANVMTKIADKASTPSSSDLADQVAVLRNDLGSLTQMIADLGKAKGDEVLSTAKSKAVETRDAATDAAETARLHAMEVQGHANDFIKNQPAAALGIAAGIGFLIGIMGTRK